MAAIKPLERIAQKWATVTPQRTDEYVAGVQSPRVAWDTATAAATPAWAAGVQQAIQAGAFQKGVARAGNARWQANSVSKGSQRWGPGVAQGQADYSRGFGPYRQVIEGVQLPQRFARRDPRNLARVAAIVQALSEAKKRLA